MPWPSPSDYNAAIQNPSCFRDPVLRAGRVDMIDGLPASASGNFAVVYQMKSGRADYAIRCFTREVADLQYRYDALSRALQVMSLDALVDFTYMPNEMRVRGDQRPILRMAWADGDQLHQYLAKYRQDSQRLTRLAVQWQEIMRALKAAHLAHGDLQHGNILVDNMGKIRLVDYDGMFTPILRGKPPGEVGHRNYQHPGRAKSDFYNENLDAFPAVVIALSLRALSVDTSLWSFHEEGENLLFKEDDFKKPGATPIWDHLLASQDGTVRQMTVALQGYCRDPIEKIPGLDFVMDHLPVASPARVVPRVAPRPVPSPTVRPISAVRPVQAVSSPALPVPQRAAPRSPAAASPRQPATASPTKRRRSPVAWGLVLALVAVGIVAMLLFNPFSSSATAGARPSATSSPSTSTSTFLYPKNNQRLSYSGTYALGVQPVTGAQGYQWEFKQNGNVIWESQRDDGQLSSSSYVVAAGSDAHSRFSPGYLEVSVRALVSGKFVDAGTLLLFLE